MATNGEVTFKITNTIWKLNKLTNGWQKEVNLVAWNNGKPRLDIRDWSSDRTKMKKGITLNKEEVLELRKCLNNINLDFLYEDIGATTEVRTDPGPCGSSMSYISQAEMERIIANDIKTVAGERNREINKEAKEAEMEETSAEILVPEEEEAVPF